VGPSPSAQGAGGGAAGPGAGAERVLRLDLEYDGERFCGWQRQPRDRSVQQVLEEALSRVLGEEAGVVGAGRTDAGVHALRATASVRTRSRLPAATVERALDALLPEDVGVVAVSDAPPGFHALRDARWKWYRYAWLASRRRRVHLRRTAWRVAGPLDEEAMARAAGALVGERDFACFQSSGSPRRSTVRRLAGLRVAPEPPLLVLDAVADGFLYGMVRAIAGTLLDVGRGARDPSGLAALLASRDRTLAGAAAPPHGLVLVMVGYAGDRPPGFVDPSLGLGPDERA
jgi:tRNA pseudouridine38-40 synthase